MSLVMSAVESPKRLWADFAKAVGRKVMRDSYGWDAPPEEARWGETLFSFSLPLGERNGHGAQVGWTSIAGYPKEPSDFEVGIGVWPAHQGNGYRQEMLEMTARVAFESWKADQLVMLVLDSNEAHQSRCLRESVEQGSPWVYSGEVWYPDAYKVFTLTLGAWKKRQRILRSARPAKTS